MYLDPLDRISNHPAAQPAGRSGEGVASILSRLVASRDAGAVPEGRSTSQGLQLLDRKTIRVLVVDDNESARYALARGMRHLGFGTMEAATGAEAMEAAPSCAAVLLDVKLPDLFGTEVCKLLRARPETAMMPIFHISSAPLSDHKLKDADVECADGYYVTPTDLNELASAIERMLAARGLA